MADAWMIYGANGFTGRLIAEVAARRGLHPIVAGRRADAVEAVARQFGFEARVFPVEAMAKHLDGVRVLVLAAGPFVHTSSAAVAACLERGCHYLDITGEIDVFETLRARDAEAKRTSVALLPGVGFDVVPSDCLAATLAEALPGATRLDLAISGAQVSRGTAKTVLLHLAEGGVVREDGVLRPVPLAWKTRTIPFADKPRFAMTIPWGDVSTAFHSTGIANIRVYAGASPVQVRQLRLGRPLVPLLSLGPVRRFAERRIEKRVTGPDAEARASRRGQLWGRVEDAAGNAIEATLTTPEPYALTAETAVEAAQRALAGLSAGFHTPSTAFGAAFVTEFPGVTLRLPASAASA